MAASDAGGVVAAWSEAWRGGATDLAVSVQYATLQQAWGAATHGVRAQARAQVEAARRLGTEVVKPLQVVVRATALLFCSTIQSTSLLYSKHSHPRHRMVCRWRTRSWCDQDSSSTHPC